MEKKNKFTQVEKYDLKGRKAHAKQLMEKYLLSEKKDEKDINEIILLDNTLPDIYLFKLQNSNDAKLKEKSYDLVDKDILKEFNIRKNINYKELYFELISYIESINLDEPKNASEGFESEEFEIEKNDENDETENNSSNEIEENEEEETNIIQKVDIKKNDLD